MGTTLTFNERLTVANAVYCEMETIQRARHMLDHLIEEYFSGEDRRRHISMGIDYIEETLSIISETIYHALLSYARMTGDDTIDGMNSDISLTLAAAGVLRADAVARKAIDYYKEKTNSNDEYKKYRATLDPLFDLSDEQMIAAVENLMKEGDNT